VYLVKDENTNDEYVVKDVFVKFDSNRIYSSIDSIQKLTSNPYVVKIYYLEKSAQNIHIIMEYCRGGSLQEFIEKRPINRPLDEVV
jgi:serine/threonine protein kinase